MPRARGWRESEFPEVFTFFSADTLRMGEVLLNIQEDYRPRQRSSPFSHNSVKPRESPERP